MDYGHDLLFGAFITPSAQQPHEVVALVQAAEQAGLDLATFQDHPYQPAFLDTWTLMSYAAAATSRIRLTGNVLNLPLRQPVVLARSVASLDLLTGGRIELGIGAGALLGRYRSGRRPAPRPGESVEALGEAIEDHPRRLGRRRPRRRHADGKHYRVVGAKRGPAPAHAVGIWVGAYKPRMLRLIGAMADGWLPSLPYLPGGPADLPALNAVIDDAATAAGREPRAIRRLLNITGPLASSVEDLASLAVDHGVSGFIAMGDDASSLRRFGEETAPAVREIVAAARSSSSAVTEPERDVAHLSDRWDESTRPVAPRNPEPATRGVGDHLVQVHDHLRQELAQIRDLLAQVRDGAVDAAYARSALNTMSLRQNNWTLGAYCAAYCTVVTQHHGIEDGSVFPHLRRADPALGPVLDRLAEEHVVIHEVVEGVDRALVDLLHHPDDFGAVQKALDELTEALLSHLAYEEDQIVEPLSRFGFFPGQA